MKPIDKVTRLPANGQTTIHVTPPRPCGLGDCEAELHVTIGHDSMRLHLGPQQRRGLIEALTGGLPDDALPDADERALQRGAVR